MKLKHIFLIFFCLTLAACQSSTITTEVSPGDLVDDQSVSEEQVDLYVFAAASMTETMTEIAELYKAQNPNVNVIFTFDSSGTLKTQIQEGAVADIFISAAQKQMNQLEVGNEANTEGLDFVKSETRINLVENKVVLVVPARNPAGVSVFADMTKEDVKKIALGNQDVPVGQYSEELLKNLGIWEEIQPKITFGSNVKEVTTWVSSGSVDCGIVYSTDAFSAGLEVVDTATNELIKTPIIYPAAVLKTSSHPEIALDFLSFLHSDEAKTILQKVGFAIP
jgi:molybdate transport system substrate-binding protein